MSLDLVHGHSPIVAAFLLARRKAALRKALSRVSAACRCGSIPSVLDVDLVKWISTHFAGAPHEV